MKTRNKREKRISPFLLSSNYDLTCFYPLRLIIISGYGSGIEAVTLTKSLFMEPFVDRLEPLPSFIHKIFCNIYHMLHCTIHD